MRTIVSRAGSLCIGTLLLLISLLGLRGIAEESAVRLAYVLLLVDAVVSLLFATGKISWFGSNLKPRGRSIAPLVVSLLSWLLFAVLGVGFNLVDSSHGGSLFILVAGSLGVCFLGIFVSLKPSTDKGI
jgi:hypothetical protein